MQFEYSTAEDLNDSLLRRLGRYPRVPDLTWDMLRWLGTHFAISFLRLQFKIEIEGELPQAKRLVLVANHHSHLDTVTLFAALPSHIRRNLAVLAAEDYFFKRIDRAIAASLLCRAVAFDRLHKTALKEWCRHLMDLPDGNLLFYPSGSRKSTELQKGLLKLFLQSGWTIVPVRLEGTDKAWTADKSVWTPFQKLKVVFLPPYLNRDINELMMQLQQAWAKPGDTTNEKSQ